MREIIRELNANIVVDNNCVIEYRSETVVYFPGLPYFHASASYCRIFSIRGFHSRTDLGDMS